MKRGVLLLALLLCACATVQPWDRGRLAQRCMEPAPNRLQAAMDLHVHLTREAMLGASTQEGASCGCN